MENINKLELSWIGKSERRKIEKRILIEDKDKSYLKKKSEKDIKDNILIHGDNLLALKALEVKFTNKIKCIYIDPPYNTGSAYKEYDDGLEHSIWLSLMRDRLEILRKLLKPDGVIFVSIDDDEGAYLKVLMDEIFGRKNFCGNFIWQKKKKASFLSNMGVVTEYVLSYAKDKIQSPDFNFGETTLGKMTPINNAGNGVKILKFPIGSVQFQCEDQVFEPQDMSEGKIITKLLDTLVIKNKTNKNEFRLQGEFRYSQNKINDLIKENIDEIIISKKPFRPNHKKNSVKPKKITNLLDMMGKYKMSTNEDATAESINIFGNDKNFSYPKPEKLIKTLLETVTKEGDIVLDSFAGSGTTGAVAHKIKRRWILIELGNHCYTHILPRIKRIIDGNDNFGISDKSLPEDELKKIEGGGFKFYTLAPSLLKKDKWNNWVINDNYNELMLSKAMCIHMGFDHIQKKKNYWMDGKSTENDYIYVSPRSLTDSELQKISLDVGHSNTLLICCKGYNKEVADKLDNITLKKIPNSILSQCEWSKDDYSLEKILEEKSNK
jgi:adenine-specific DNA-methyltransferase